VIILNEGRVVQDADVDELRGAAHQVAGRALAVDAYLAGRTVLSRQRVGGLATAVVEGTPSVEDRAAAAEGDLDLGPVSLQQLVAAYGFEGEPNMPVADPATEGARS
jgi:ABC-2 type transport system ATP-binding protein